MRSPIPERTRWAVTLLDVAEDDHVLEIGCGAGHALALVAERLGRSTVTGIDRSAAMVARASARNAAAIEAGRVRVLHQSLADAARAVVTGGDGAGAFPKVLAVNVNAFWTAPAPSLSALARVVLSRGGAWLVYEPPTATVLRRLQRLLPRVLEDGGFTAVDVREHTSGRRAMIALSARPPESPRAA